MLECLWDVSGVCVWGRGGRWGAVIGREFRSPLYFPDTLVNPDTCLSKRNFLSQIFFSNFFFFVEIFNHIGQGVLEISVRTNRQRNYFCNIDSNWTKIKLLYFSQCVIRQEELFASPAQFYQTFTPSAGRSKRCPATLRNHHLAYEERERTTKKIIIRKLVSKGLKTLS